MAHKDTHTLIPQTGGYVTLHSKRNFAVMIKVKNIVVDYL